MDISDIKLNDIIISNDKKALEEYLYYLNIFLKEPLIKRRLTFIKEIILYIKNYKEEQAIGNYSLNDLYNIITSEELLHTSKYFFPNHKVIMYPNYKEDIAKKNYICNISANEIKKNTTYYRYGFFLEDFYNKKRYTLQKKLIVASAYIDILPNNIFELEQLCFRLEHAYEFNDEYGYDISVNLSRNSFKLLELKSKH